MFTRSFAEEHSVVLFPVLVIYFMVVVHPEILNTELVSLSCLINHFCYRFDGVGIRIELFHVLF